MDWLENIEFNMKMGHSTSNLHVRQMIDKIKRQQKEIEELEEENLQTSTELMMLR